MNEKKARIVAYYLPQFYPIPENDQWWGKGFTEWLPVSKARSLFKGHYQPRVPGELGYYDLREPGVRLAQAKLAEKHGIEGFCYWHYWFSGREILEYPFNAVLQSGQPDFPFCLGWANHSWHKKMWYGGDSNELLIEQVYPGQADYTAHFSALLKAFKDSRYMMVDDRKLFLVYRPHEIPNPREFVECWQALAKNAGLAGLWLIAVSQDIKMVKEYGFDAITPNEPSAMLRRFVSSSLRFRIYKKLNPNFNLFHGKRYNYGDVIKYAFSDEKASVMKHPCIVPNWDVSARYDREGWLLHGSTPELFRRHLKAALQQVSDYEPDKRIIFVKSWNEWSEGNYLEPDQRFGRAYLEVIKNEIFLGNSQ